MVMPSSAACNALFPMSSTDSFDFNMPSPCKKALAKLAIPLATGARASTTPPITVPMPLAKDDNSEPMPETTLLIALPTLLQKLLTELQNPMVFSLVLFDLLADFRPFFLSGLKGIVQLCALLGCNRLTLFIFFQGLLKAS